MERLSNAEKKELLAFAGSESVKRDFRMIKKNRDVSIY